MKAPGIFIALILLIGHYACSLSTDRAAPQASVENGISTRPASDQPLSGDEAMRLRKEADSLLQLANDDATADAQKSALFYQAWTDLYRLRDKAAWHETLLDYCRFLRNQEKSDSVVLILNQALEQAWWPDDGVKGHINLMMGFMLRNSGRNYAALSYLEKAKICSDRYGNVTDENPAGIIYKTLAGVQTRLGDYEPAIKTLSEALLLLDNDHLPEHQVDNQLTKAELYIEMGIAYQSEDNPKKSLEHYELGQSVLDAMRNIPADKMYKWRNTRGVILTNIAEIKLLFKESLPAETAIKTAITSIHPNKYNYLFNAYSTLADVYAATGRDSLANHTWLHALAIGREGAVEKREMSKLLNRIGWNAYDKKDFSTAIHYAQQALHELFPAVDSSDFKQNPNAKLFDPSPENTVAEALDLKGEALYQRNKSEGKQQFLALADSTTALAIDMMENLRDVMEYESSKLRSTGESRRLFGRMMRILFAEKENGIATATSRAFVYAEKSRAVLLRQKLANDAALPKSAKTDTLLANERDLKDQWVNLRNELFERQMEPVPDDEREKELAAVREINQRIYKIEGRIREIHQKIAAKYHLTTERQDDHVVDASSVQKNLLRKNESWIEYFTDPDSNLVYLLVIDGHAVQFLRQPYHESDVRDFIEIINNERIAENRAGEPAVWGSIVRQNRLLYERLLQPAFPGGVPPRLTIVPDGALALLPFDVLLYEAPSGDSVEAKYDLPYLVNRCQLRVVPSGSLELWYKNIPRASNTSTYVGFAPDYSNSSLGQVKSGTQVVLDAAAAFNGKAYIGPEARLDTFLRYAAGCAIVHFHGHAEASDSFPDYSWMAFSAGQPIAGAQTQPLEVDKLGPAGRMQPGEYDNCLFAHQVYNSRLNAALVLLSACQTGLGKIAPGEGTLSLSRAFQAAGCPATVMSLWEVKDDATAQIMRLFLKNIRKGQDKDEALANAKREYIRKYHRAFPYYWAGYVLTGTSDPVVFPWSPWDHPFLLSAIALLVAGLFSYWLLRRRKTP